jgi:RimJ/RimL family protein N-acetyltransferase
MSDLDDLHAIMSDPTVMRFWSTEPHRGREETGRFLGAMVGEAHRGLDFILDVEGRAVGKAGAWRPPEIGFLLSRKLWGRGLMNEALRAVIPHLFATTDVPQLTADVDPRNVASLVLLEELGFEVTGRAERTFLTYGEWADSVYLACPRSS